jgi:EPS-associated MarR family transcriptional regulator
MTIRRQTANDDTLFWTLKVLQENPGVSQRTLAKEVGINVSTINFCLKALVEKGWIKMGNFSKNPDKLSYAYLLTPTGVAEKAVLTRRFLQRKMAEYEKLRGEIEALQLEAEPDEPHQTAASVNQNHEPSRHQTSHHRPRLRGPSSCSRIRQATLRRRL